MSQNMATMEVPMHFCIPLCSVNNVEHKTVETKYYIEPRLPILVTFHASQRSLNSNVTPRDSGGQFFVAREGIFLGLGLLLRGV